jgi:hypothetical protein
MLEKYPIRANRRTGRSLLHEFLLGKLKYVQSLRFVARHGSDRYANPFAASSLVAKTGSASQCREFQLGLQNAAQG